MLASKVEMVWNRSIFSYFVQKEEEEEMKRKEKCFFGGALIVWDI